MSGVTTFPVTATSPIKSIQRGIITITSANTTANATLSAVVMGKSVEILLGARALNSGDPTLANIGFTMQLTSTTNLQIVRTTTGAANDCYCAFVVVEFN